MEMEELNEQYMDAAYDGDLATVIKCVEAGCHLYYGSYEGTALHWAAEGGHLDIVKYLVDAGMDIDHKWNENYTTPLFLAAAKGHLDVVKYLVEAGADKYIDDEYEHTPNMEAAYWGHIEVVKYFIKSGATDIQDSFIYSACRNRNIELIKYLLQFVNINCINTNGESALSTAIDYGSKDVIRFLINAGADYSKFENKKYLRQVIIGDTIHQTFDSIYTHWEKSLVDIIVGYVS